MANDCLLYCEILGLAVHLLDFHHVLTAVIQVPHLKWPYLNVDFPLRMHHI